MAIRSQDSLAMAAAKEAVVRRMIAAVQGDVTEVGDLLSDDAVYHFPGRSELAGTHRGRTNVVGLIADFDRKLGDPPRLASHDVVASEAHVVELSSYTAERGGKAHEWRVVRIYHVGKDRITEIWLMVEDINEFDAWLGSADAD